MFLPPSHKSVKKWGISCNFWKNKFILIVKNRAFGGKKIYFSRPKTFFKITFFSSQNPIFHDQKNNVFSENYMISHFCFFFFLGGGGVKTNFPLVQSSKRLPKPHKKNEKNSFFFNYLNF